MIIILLIIFSMKFLLFDSHKNLKINHIRNIITPKLENGGAKDSKIVSEWTEN